MTTHDDDDEDFPLADLPGPGGPKAGDPDMNRARDIMHLDVQKGRLSPQEAQVNRQEMRADSARPEVDFEKTMLPPEAPVMKAWNAFRTSGGYDKAISNFDLFMAGWAARDAQ